MSSPTQRSLELLRKEGYPADRGCICERRIPVPASDKEILIAMAQGLKAVRALMYRSQSKDLFGFLDLLVYGTDHTLGVQTTSGSNLAARITKARESEHFAGVLRAGWRLEFHGWRKLKPIGRQEWFCRRERFRLPAGHGEIVHELSVRGFPDQFERQAQDDLTLFA